MQSGLHKAFVDELRDAYDAERQLLKALPTLAQASSSQALRDAFLSHLDETRGHVERLEEVFASIDERVRGKHCDGIAGIIEEGKAILEDDLDAATLDACLIAAAQRSEHYEMAAYGTLVAWARAMGHEDAATLLDGILAEEKAADDKLNALAEGGINAQAAGAARADAAPRQSGVLASVTHAVFGSNTPPARTTSGRKGRSSKTRSTGKKRGGKPSPRKKARR